MDRGNRGNCDLVSGCVVWFPVMQTHAYHSHRTIVGTESKTYTFWVPPYVSALTKPITPFPTMVKYLPPGQAAEVGRAEKKYDHQFTILHNMQLATL